MKNSTLYVRIYQVVRSIPYGKVSTYGQIAELSGLPGHARQVGYALHRLPENTDVPWHRVINRNGRISLQPAGSGSVQRRLLESEGIIFTRDGFVSLEEYGWKV